MTQSGRRLYAHLPLMGEPLLFAVPGAEGITMMDAADVTPLPGDQVVLFAPGTDVLHRRVTLPPGAGNASAALAAFAIEDDLAVDPVSLHIALGPDHTGCDTRAVLAVCRDRLTHWQAISRSYGLPDALIVADMSVLPQGADIALGVEVHDRYVFSIGGAVFALDASLPDEAVCAVLASCGARPEILGPALAQATGIRASALTPVPILIRLARWAEEADLLTDLVTGAAAGRLFAHRRRAPGPWQRAGLLSAASLAAAFCVLGAETMVLGETSRALEDQVAGYGEPVIGAQSGDAPLGFLEASAHIHAALPSTDGAYVKSLNYDGSTGQLSADMAYPDFADGDALKLALEAAGLSVQTDDARRQGDEVMARVLVEHTP